MKNTLSISGLVALGIVTPGLLHAVAVPPELLQNEGSMHQGFLYGVMFVIFAFGIVLGLWIKKRMH